jgi:hypothetical protein
MGENARVRVDRLRLGEEPVELAGRSGKLI